MVIYYSEITGDPMGERVWPEGPPSASALVRHPQGSHLNLWGQKLCEGAKPHKGINSQCWKKTEEFREPGHLPEAKYNM